MVALKVPAACINEFTSNQFLYYFLSMVCIFHVFVHAYVLTHHILRQSFTNPCLIPKWRLFCPEERNLWKFSKHSNDSRRIAHLHRNPRDASWRIATDSACPSIFFNLVENHFSLQTYSTEAITFPWSRHLRGIFRCTVSIRRYFSHVLRLLKLEYVGRRCRTCVFEDVRDIVNYSRQMQRVLHLI